MSEQEIFNELIDIFKSSVDDPNRDYSSITMETGLFDELGISSISAIYMVLEIESRFGISLNNEEASKLRTVKDLVALIQKS